MTNKEFKEAARKHQVNYREKNISFDYNTNATWLTDDAGKAGKNFYNGFGVFKAVQQRYPNFYVDLYSDMLRSEHIPFNLFVPFRNDLEFCKNVFNDLLGGCIKSIDKSCIIDNKDNIKIEFAPNPKENYLDDRTSFDAYIEYTHIDNTNGIICIEVKYTEKEYPLKQGSKEEADINNKNSKYYFITDSSKIYNQDALSVLPSDKLRQIWRNQLLCESVRLKHSDKFKHSSSLTFYPKDNGHFADVSEKYIDMLQNKKNKFVPVTYENFLASCYHHCPNNDFRNWIDYLQNRYIINNKNTHFMSSMKNFDIKKVIETLNDFRGKDIKSVYTVQIIEKYYEKEVKMESAYRSDPSSNAMFGKELSNNSLLLGIEKAWDKSKPIRFTNSAGVTITVTTMLWNI